MQSELSDPWILIGFLDRLDEWAEQEKPDQNLVLVVTAWILTRIDLPYQGVRRESGFGDLWYGIVPSSAHADGQVVVCAYWIEQSTHTLRCDSFATLSYPV